VNYEAVKAREFPEIVQTIDDRDVILYALGVGYGCDPSDEGQLRYVLEKNLVASPTMASVVGSPGAWMADPESSIAHANVVHAQQAVTVHRPLPTSGTFVARTKVTAVVDKGEGRGAIVYQERTVVDEEGRAVAEVSHASFCRGEGGLSASDPEPEAPPPVPEGRPDTVCKLKTVPQAALLYRLSGDRNPLHAEPAAAARAGYPRPILHGLATYGVAGHAILRTWCAYDASRLAAITCRFTAPVFPGETIHTEMWRRDDRVHFRSRVAERDVVVLDRGLATLT
jgi:acyl dehydratase